MHFCPVAESFVGMSCPEEFILREGFGKVSEKKRVKYLRKSHLFPPHRLSSSFLPVLSALPSPVSVLFLSSCTMRIKKVKKKKWRKRDEKLITHINILYQRRVFLCIFFFFFHIGYYYYYYYYYYHIITITINTTTITITLPLLLLLINCYYVVCRIVKFSESQRSTRDEATSIVKDEDKAMCPDAISTFSDHHCCISSFPLASGKYTISLA